MVDDNSSDNGDIAGGWTLNISTANTVAPGADLSVLATDAPDPVQTNGTYTYTVGVTNFGPAAASGVVVTNVLPANASFVSVAGSAAGATYTINGSVLRASLNFAVQTVVIRLDHDRPLKQLGHIFGDAVTLIEPWPDFRDCGAVVDRRDDGFHV